MRIKIVIILPIVFSSIVFTCFSQRLSPSQRRAQEQQEAPANDQQDAQPGDKNSVTAEPKSNVKKVNIRSATFEDTDTLFDIRKVSAKWINESAVVIHQKMVYSYLRDNSSINIKEVVRKRIKLNDKAAVNDFSTLYYLSSGNESTIGIKIIKANGKTVNVSTLNAVTIDSDIPGFYRSNYIYQTKYKKLAVPDLEPGDIIDYYYNSTRQESGESLEKAFDPLIFTLSTTYPVLNQNIEFIIDRGFYINFNSYNGAPSIKEGEAGTDSHGRKRNSIKRFELVDKDREKLPEEIWSYKYRSSPTVKFQVIYESSSAVNKTTNFIGEIGKVKHSVAPEEVKRIIERKNLAQMDVSFSDKILRYLNKKFPDENNPEKIAMEAYNCLRFEVMNNFLIVDETDPEKNFFHINEYNLLNELQRVFKRKRIDAQIFAGVPRHIGKLEDLLLSTELRFGLKIKGKKDSYILSFSKHAPFNQPDCDMEGAEVYAFSTLSSSKAADYERFRLPESSFLNNNITSVLDIDFDVVMEKIKVKRESNISGLAKQIFSDVCLLGYDFLKEDRKKYDLDYKEKSAKSSSKINEDQKEAEKTEELKNVRDKLRKQILMEDFNVDSYESYNLLEPGRFEEKPNLIFNETFSLQNLINRAGKNYIFNVGKLIGKQLVLDENDLNRTFDISIPYAKSITNKITVNIPSGFKVEGLNDLNFNIDNESASFISSAVIEGSKLIVKTQKNYKRNTDKKENWSKMVSALEAAYTFTQKKVILKKI